MRNSQTTKYQDSLKALKALSSPVRLKILGYLKKPAVHFEPQVDGDFKTDGVCGDYFREKLGLAAATTSRHLSVLVEANFIIPTRKKGWTFYRRNEAALHSFTKHLAATL
jgi:DNA-binding transcriptional ArsR family regulator